MQNIDDIRNEFEAFILLNRLDNPEKYGIRRDSFFTDAYEDPRLTCAWMVFKFARGFE